MYLRSALAVLAFLLMLPSVGQCADRRPTVVKAEVKVVPCDYVDCVDKEKHGAIVLAYSDGKRVQVTKIPADGAHPRAIDPQIAPDRQTVGWLEGAHVKTNTSYYFYGVTTLVLYGHGQVLATRHGSRRYIEKWFFWNKGRQIAMLSRGSHGPADDELYDVLTGRLIASVYGPKLNEKSPEWARKLGN